MKKEVLKVGETYRIYGKTEGMKKVKPLCGDHFVDKTIHADLFFVRDEKDIDLLEKEISFLNTQGNFEFRNVK